MRIQPIETCLGDLIGRDCIFLDKINHNYIENNVELIGEINGRLTQIDSVDWIKYSLKFKGVKYFNMVELDISDKYINYDISNSTSFFEILDSDLIKHIQCKRGWSLRHFILQTYDDVFEVAANNYELKINE
ncbi:hypothetical protein [Saccharibacillus sp. JS10]|uniref:hypothetical protein n=1 Tax=Saccharibacillus sp. JS10 TaxID=2950552 RepID=UPI00210BB855|nr:hypothetical protein [Saccharibacillus sp. JS10]MCQ4088442.1 hypothetical protein [Saccharibacillus sp. JS10]